MIISLDYDNTYTRDPKFWLEFVKRSIDCGHTVICVTMRYEREKIENAL